MSFFDHRIFNSPITKALAHLFVSTAITTAAGAIYSGAPITSGNVLIPGLVAGGLAVGHAVFPSIIAPQAPK